MDSTQDFSALDDAALIELVALSSGATLSAATGALYDRYGRLVYTVALRVVGDVETAEEITQDVFVRAWDAAHAYRPEMAKLGSWLASITRHRAIDELRRRAARPEKDRAAWPEDSETESGLDLPSDENTEEAAAEDLQQQRIRQVISALPRDQRRVLGLAFYQGLSHSEIASQLGEPLGTIKGRLRLAMQKLRDALLAEKVVEE